MAESGFYMSASSTKEVQARSLTEPLGLAYIKTRHLERACRVNEDGCAVYCRGAIEGLQVRLLARDMGRSRAWARSRELG